MFASNSLTSKKWMCENVGVADYSYPKDNLQKWKNNEKKKSM